MSTENGNSKHPEVQLSPRLMTPDEAAEALRVHKNTIWKLVRQGDLPARRIGSRIVRIAAADVEALLTEYVGGEFGRWSK